MSGRNLGPILSGKNRAEARPEPEHSPAFENHVICVTCFRGPLTERGAEGYDREKEHGFNRKSLNSIIKTIRSSGTSQAAPPAFCAEAEKGA